MVVACDKLTTVKSSCMRSYLDAKRVTSAVIFTRASLLPVRLQRVFAPACDAQRQPWHGIDADEVSGRSKHHARPEILVFGQVAELHHGFVV